MLIWHFRQLGEENQKSIAISQLRVLAESARQAYLEAQLGEAKKAADEHGIKLT